MGRHFFGILFLMNASCGLMVENEKATESRMGWVQPGELPPVNRSQRSGGLISDAELIGRFETLQR
jgi:hypothetical protein